MDNYDNFSVSLQNIYDGLNAVILSKLFKEHYKDCDDEESIETLEPFFKDCDCIETIFHSQFSLHLKQYGTLFNHQIEDYLQTACFDKFLKTFRNSFFFFFDTLDDMFYSCSLNYIESIIKLKNNPLIQKKLPFLWEYDLKDVVPTKEGIELVNDVFSHVEDTEIRDVLVCGTISSSRTIKKFY